MQEEEMHLLDAALLLDQDQNQNQKADFAVLC